MLIGTVHEFAILFSNSSLECCIDDIIAFYNRELGYFSAKKTMHENKPVDTNPNLAIDVVLEKIIDETKEELERTYPHLEEQFKSPLTLAPYEVEFMKWIISSLSMLVEENFCTFIDSSYSSVSDLIATMQQLAKLFNVHPAIEPFTPILLIEKYISSMKATTRYSWYV